MIRDEIEKMAKTLTESYGTDRLTLAEVAQVLRRSRSGLAYTMASSVRRRQRWAQRLRLGKIRMGRQCLYRVAAVAETALLGDSDEKIGISALPAAATASKAAHESNN